MSAKIDQVEVEKARQLQVLMSIADELHVPYTFNYDDMWIDFSAATQQQTEALMCALSNHGELID